MRYYKIELTNKTTGKPITPSSLAGAGMPPGTITSALKDGSMNPAALNIEMDLTVYPGHAGDISSYVRIWGLGLKDISQAFNLNGQAIKIFGGMAKGYPLADPAQQGLLVQGEIAQAFANWQGTDQTLELFLRPATGSAAEPKNYTFTWAKSETLAVMVERVLKQAMPAAKRQITVSNKRIANQDKPGFYASFQQFAALVREMTQGQLSTTDTGVVMATDGQTVRVFEGTPTEVQTGVRKLRFQDLLGQVTWFAPQQVTAKLVMRGDLAVGDWIEFPVGLVATTTPQAMSGYGGTGGGGNPSNSLTFKGRYQINQVQHWGNFRLPDAQSWNTTIWAAFLQPGSPPA